MPAGPMDRGEYHTVGHRTKPLASSLAVESQRRLWVGAFGEQRELGGVFAQDTTFKIERDPDTVRAPDWVAEIFSPSDGPGAVLESVGRRRAAGGPLGWAP